MTKRHAQIEQLDGNTSVKEDSEDAEIDKYAETIRYWKEGKLGTSFQFHLDAIEIIETSHFSE